MINDIEKLDIFILYIAMDRRRSLKMNDIRFFIYQLLLFFSLFFVNFYIDLYLSKPFSFVDLITICIAIPLLYLIGNLMVKSYRHIQARLRHKILLSIIAFMTAFILLAIFDNHYDLAHFFN